MGNSALEVFSNLPEWHRPKLVRRTKKKPTGQVARRSPLAELPLTRAEIRKIAGVDDSTVRRWMRGASEPPPGVLKLLAIVSNLGTLDPEWAGWSIRDGKLISPENWVLTQGEVRSIPLYEARFAALRQRIASLEEQIESGYVEDQPEPGQWEVALTG